MIKFIPKQYKRVPITIRIDLKKLEKVDELAAKYKISRSGFINQCIDFAVNREGEQ